MAILNYSTSLKQNLFGESMKLKSKNTSLKLSKRQLSSNPYRCKSVMITCAANIEEKKRAVVVGGGPAGILAAHYLLKTGKYTVDIFERREDPRKENSSSFRQYSLGLGARGRTAMQGIEGLWDAMKAAGLESDKFQIHIGSRAINIRGKTSADPSVLINRGDMCGVMLQQLPEQDPSLRLHFNQACTGVNLENKTATFESDNSSKTAVKTTMEYDLLVGADGVRSAVRSAFEGRDGFESTLTELPGRFKVLHQEMPAPLDLTSVHAMFPSGKPVEGEGKFGLFIIPARDKQCCMLVNWELESEPELLKMTDPKLIQQAIAQRYPEMDAIQLSTAQQLIDQQPSRAGVVTASRYCDPAGQSVLLGDAAHSTGGSLGQGANSALMDVVKLAECLEESQHDIPTAVERYSESQVEEGKALLALLSLNSPRNGTNRLFAAVYLIWSLIQTKLSEIFPKWCNPNVQTLLTQSTIPYSEIARQNKFWLNLLKPKGATIGI